MKYFVAYLLEPLSQLLYFSVLFFWAYKDKRGIIKILTGYYFLAGLLILKTTTLEPGESNIQMYSLLCVLTSFGLGAYFYTVLQKSLGKKVALIACLINGIYYILNNLVYNTSAVFDSMAFVILSSSIVILIFMFMYQLLSQVKEEPLSMNFDFWFVSSQLLYFLGSFVIFLTYGYMTKKALAVEASEETSTVLTWLWGYHNVLLFLSALLTSGGIVWISFQRKSS